MECLIYNDVTIFRKIIALAADLRACPLVENHITFGVSIDPILLMLSYHFVQNLQRCVLLNMYRGVAWEVLFNWDVYWTGMECCCLVLVLKINM